MEVYFDVGPVPPDLRGARLHTVDESSEFVPRLPGNPKVERERPDRTSPGLQEQLRPVWPRHHAVETDKRSPMKEVDGGSDNRPCPLKPDQSVAVVAPHNRAASR